MKNQLSGVGRTVRALGADSPRVFDIYLIYEIFGKSFREKCASRRTVRVPYADGPLFTSKPNRTACNSVDRADGPRGPRGQSAGSSLTVRPAQQPLLPAVDFAFLPLEFKHGQSSRASRTVREVRTLPITASNRKGEYKYSKPGVGEALLAL
jgi:hypothetical protein